MRPFSNIERHCQAFGLNDRGGPGEMHATGHWRLLQNLGNRLLCRTFGARF